MNQKLKEYFENHSDCYAVDFIDNDIKAMTFEAVAQTVNHFINERDEKVKKLVEELKKIDYNEDSSEAMQDSLYATKRFLTSQCEQLAEGIEMYLKDAEFIVVKKSELESIITDLENLIKNEDE